VRLYDTATRTVRDFVPREPGKVGMYVCGLTVQSAPHIGHIRSAVNFDVLRRWLVYRGFDVTYVRNITDIDDKILLKSAEEGREWWAHAYLYERAVTRAYSLVGVLPPTYEPRATGAVPEMIELIETLIERGHAYVAPDGSGDVYFDVRSWPEYGSLSHQRLDDMEPAEDADPRGKRDPRDFALWKGRKASEPESASWPTPWGRGRPGWHIECSAMVLKFLGPEFDVHGGGIDLRFPHHENEIAQSRAAGLPFARYWMHNAWLTTAGEKMSKSLGNSLLVPEVVKRARPIELRYYVVSAHYRSTQEFSFDALDEAAATFRRIEGFLSRAAERHGRVEPAADLPLAFSEAMDDDLATPTAIAVLQEHVREGNRLLADGSEAQVPAVAAEVRGMLAVLGLDPYDPAWAGDRISGDERLQTALDALVTAELERRQQARAERDFATADAVRDRLKAAGIAVEDTPNGPRWSLSEGED
jgi:cysteinyl-tRNA synthetase